MGYRAPSWAPRLLGREAFLEGGRWGVRGEGAGAGQRRPLTGGPLRGRIWVRVWSLQEEARVRPERWAHGPHRSPRIPGSHPPLLKFWYLEDSESGRKAGLGSRLPPAPGPPPPQGRASKGPGVSCLPTWTTALYLLPGQARPNSPGPSGLPALHLSHRMFTCLSASPLPHPASRLSGPLTLQAGGEAQQLVLPAGKGGGRSWGGRRGRGPGVSGTTAPQPPRGALAVQLWGSEVQGLGLSSASWGPSHGLLWGCDPSGPGIGGLVLPCWGHVGVHVHQGPRPGLPDHCKGQGGVGWAPRPSCQRCPSMPQDRAWPRSLDGHPQP